MIKRTASKILIKLRQKYPVLSLTGPRQSGKTTLAKALFSDYQYVNLENRDLAITANEDPRGFLSTYSEKVIFDEIQKTPDLVSYLQEIVDNNPSNGQFILTGSEHFTITDTINQSLAGRVAHVKLLPLTLKELYEDKVKAKDIDDIIFTGFYPRIFKEQLDPYDFYLDYIESYLQRDVRNLLNIRNLTSFFKFIKVCASNTGQLLNYSNISSAVGIDVNTVKEWLSVLEASFIIFLLPPFSRNLKKRLVKSPKLYFFDVGLLCNLLGIQEATHISSHPLRGLLFENLIIADIFKRKMHGRMQNNLYFYRTQKKEEIDLVFDNVTEIKTLEIKSSTTFTPSFTKELQRFQSHFSENSTSGLFFVNEQTTDLETYKNIKLLGFDAMNKIASW